MLRVLLTALLLPAASAQIPIPSAHAHNDYEHGRPLLDALDRGFMSVEADVWLVDGELLVAHDREDCRSDRTLRNLYLEPLAARVAKHGGTVHPDGPVEFMLLVDFKSNGPETWPVLREQLGDFASMLTQYRDDAVRRGAVTVVLSGRAPDAAVTAESPRLCACDGWFGDLEAGSQPTDHPLLSASWTSQFRWLGHGPFPDAERRKLRQLVQRAHAAGRKIRFWATPNRRHLWREQLLAGVDWLNVDNLPAFQNYMDLRREGRRRIDACLDRNSTVAELTKWLTDSRLDFVDVESLLRGPRLKFTPQPNLPRGQLMERKLVCEHVDYETRFLFYVPKSLRTDRAHPLLIIGHGGNGAMSRDYARRASVAGTRPWLAEAERRGFLVASPLTERGWGAIGNSILLSLISQLQREYQIDPDRVCVTGHSMGGHLSWRSALSLADRWAAVSPMSGGYDYVERGSMPLLWNVPGYATFGQREPYGIADYNRKMGAWLEERGYDWQVVEKRGGHQIFQDEIPKAAAFLMDRRRNLLRDSVFKIAGRRTAWSDPGTNARWGREHSWKADRPIPFGTAHWIRLYDRPDLADGERQEVYANRDGNSIEIRSRGARRIGVYLHRDMVDFSKNVKITVNGKICHDAPVEADVATLLELCREFDDRGRVFHALIELEIEGDETVPVPTKK